MESLEKYLSFDMFDNKRLSIGDIKRKYRQSKNKSIKNDVFKLIAKNNYDFSNVNFDEFENQQKSFRGTPKSPARKILQSKEVKKTKSLNQVRFSKGRRDDDRGNFK